MCHHPKSESRAARTLLLSHSDMSLLYGAGLEGS